jgi:hypothetical protein
MELVRKFIAATFLLAVFSVSSIANAALVSVDWKNAGDNLITRDTASGLDWLDLTETNNITRITILTLIDSGSLDGWRYATSSEVVTLWDNFGIDLRDSASNTQNGLNTNLHNAIAYLGNISCEWYCPNYPYGTMGMTADIVSTSYPSTYMILGSYYFQPTNITRYHTADGNTYASYNNSETSYGHYLVKSSPVPIPPAAWLFGSGLIGLVGFARRKKA